MYELKIRTTLITNPNISTNFDNSSTNMLEYTILFVHLNLESKKNNNIIVRSNKRVKIEFKYK